MARKTFRKVITSPELISQIHPDNKKLMERYLKNCSTKKSPNTVVNYRSNLNIFFCWCVREDVNIPFIKLKKMDFMDFFDYAVLELKWSSNRYQQMHSCLSSFSKWIERSFEGEEYERFRNLLPYIEKPVKELVRKKSVFTQEEVDQMMDWLESKNLIQDQCLLALMISSGARLSELPRFKTDIITENNLAYDNLFIETTEEIRIKGRGVNGKSELRYILKDTFLPYYYKWLVERKKIMDEHGQSHTDIFIKRDGTPANRDTVSNWMDKWDRYTTREFDKPFYAHSFRHFFITKLLSIGLEKEFIQSIISWATADMVDVYSDLKAKDRKWKGLDKLKTALEQDKSKDEKSMNTQETEKNQGNTSNN